LYAIGLKLDDPLAETVPRDCALSALTFYGAGPARSILCMRCGVPATRLGQ